MALLRLSKSIAIIYIGLVKGGVVLFSNIYISGRIDFILNLTLEYLLVVIRLETINRFLPLVPYSIFRYSVEGIVWP